MQLNKSIAIFIVEMNLLKKSCLRLFLNKNKFSFSNLSQVLQGQNQEDPFSQLMPQFQQHHSILIFKELIQSSSNIYDHINYFRIFKLLEEHHYDQTNYQEFYHLVDQSVGKKTDNLLTLLAKTQCRIAKQHQNNESYHETIKHLELALEKLEHSIVPPVLIYYQIYRYYGCVLYKMKQFQQAKQVLEESVTIIEEYIQQSQDPVATNENSKNQAKALTILAKIDIQNKVKWIQKAISSWLLYDENKFQLAEYAETIAENAKIEYEKDKNKGEGYLQFNLYQFQKNELKDILLKVKESYNP